MIYALPFLRKKYFKKLLLKNDDHQTVAEAFLLNLI